MKTKINNLDKILGEITPGECLSIGARPGVGKTALALQIALNNTSKENPILFITPESDVGELMRNRIIRNTLEKNCEETEEFINNGTVEENLIIAQKMEGLILETEIYNREDLLKTIRAYTSKYKLGLIVVDNIAFIDTDSKKESDKEEILEVTSELRELAKENNTAIIYTNQLLPLDDTTEPQITDLRCAYALSKNVDKIILVWNKENVSPVTILNCKVISLGKTEEISYNKETQTITD